MMKDLAELKTVKQGVNKKVIDLERLSAEAEEYCEVEVAELENLKARTDALVGFGELWVKDHIPCSLWLEKICELESFGIVTSTKIKVITLQIYSFVFCHSRCRERRAGA